MPAWMKRDNCMIFVTVGTQKFQLNRLLEKLDDLIEQGNLTETVFAQVGYSDYKPRNYGYVAFLNQDEMDSYILEADIIITHSGLGTIDQATKLGKRVIVFPRKKRFGEHIDNHQIEIADAFEEMNMVIKCDSEDELLVAIDKARTYEFDENDSVDSADALGEIVSGLLKQYEEEINFGRK